VRRTCLLSQHVKTFRRLLRRALVYRRIMIARRFRSLNLEIQCSAARRGFATKLSSFTCISGCMTGQRKARRVIEAENTCSSSAVPRTSCLTKQSSDHLPPCHQSRDSEAFSSYIQNRSRLGELQVRWSGGEKNNALRPSRAS